MLGTGLTGTILGITIGNLGLVLAGNLKSKRLGIFFSFTLVRLEGVEPVLGVVLVAGGGLERSGSVMG